MHAVDTQFSSGTANPFTFFDEEIAGDDANRMLMGIASSLWSANFILFAGVSKNLSEIESTAYSLLPEVADVATIVSAALVFFSAFKTFFTYR